jgi:hypothetical protein
MFQHRGGIRKSKSTVLQRILYTEIASTKERKIGKNGIAYQKTKQKTAAARKGQRR